MRFLVRLNILKLQQLQLVQSTWHKIGSKNRFSEFKEKDSFVNIGFSREILGFVRSVSEKKKKQSTVQKNKYSEKRFKKTC